MSRHRALWLAAVLAMAGTAAACTDTKSPPVAVANPMLDSAEQVLFDARALITDQGLLRAELQADTGYFFDQNTRLEMRDVHLTFHTSTGAKNAVLTSREGSYDTRYGRMEARGDVVVVTEEGRRLETPQLRYDQARDEISSDSAFVLTEPGRRLEGIGFVSDPDLRNVRILKTRGGTTGAVTIPGQ